MTTRLLHGDCLQILTTLDADSVDAIITDPPYGLGFMDRAWDTFSPETITKRRGQRARKATAYRSSLRWPTKGGSVQGGGADVQYDESPTGNRAFQSWCESWARECLRVLKPGGHLVAFGGPRTEHRLVCGIEDAGFQIRDKLVWLFGSGYPKSKNLCRCRPPSPNGADPFGWPTCAVCAGRIGLGTALKPAWEPIVLARKPLIGAVLPNVEAWGTGALNIAGCRVAVTDRDYARNAAGDRGHDNNRTRQMDDIAMTSGRTSSIGRWPANVALDEAAAAALDAQVGVLKSGANPSRRGSNKHANTYGLFEGQTECIPARGADSGGPSRFYYCAKASPAERSAGLDELPERTTLDGRTITIDNGFLRGETLRKNHHPTVKPIALMRWLVRLVTPPAGTVLDPFMGSGTTGIACVLEERDFVGIEREAEYVEIAQRRITHWQRPLFATVESS